MHDPDRIIDWAGVREALELGAMSRVAICRKFRVSRGELARRAQTSRWEVDPRDDDNDLAIWLDGCFAVLERVLTHMETIEMSDGAKEAAALQRLAATLDDLIKLRDRPSVRKKVVRQTKEMEELRQKIARRLGELAAE